ncbi:MAG: hypothetical protein HC859_07485 [Bacteroidia bacterium]|nr:hypothetical protein [Bacteroidia bacterium]
MKTTKYAILESLGEMDNLRAEQVLEYIQSLDNPRQKPDYKRFKQEALKQIRLAIQRDKGQRLTV